MKRPTSARPAGLRWPGTDRLRSRIAVLLSLAAFAACSDTGVYVPEGGDVAAISLSRDSARLTAIGASLEIRATVTTSTGAALSIPLTWESSDESVAIVAGNGETATVVATGNGSARVIASSGAAADTAQVLVRQLPHTLAVLPETLTFTALYDTLRLSATARDRNGHALTEVSPTDILWRTGDAVIAEVDGGGRVIGKRLGDSYVTAELTCDCVSPVFASVKVDPEPAELLVSPGQLGLSVGQNGLLQATARDRKGNTIVGAQMRWESHAPQVAAVDGGGMVSGLSAGTAAISASWRNQTGTSLVQVAEAAPPPVASVTVTPTSAALGALMDTVRLTAVARDASGSVVGGAPLEWLSLSTGVALVDGAGLVRANGNGTARIVARSGTAADTAQIEVRQVPASIDAQPDSLTLTVLNQAAQLAAIVRDANGYEVGNLASGDIQWTSSDPATAEVNAMGQVFGRRAGSALVSVGLTCGCVSPDATAVVVSPQVAQVVVSPSQATLAVGGATTLQATALDQGGNAIPGAVFQWASQSPAVAAVDAVGRVSGLSAGTATITASTGGLAGAASVTVTAGTDTTPPAAPADMQVTTTWVDSTTFSVTATWQAVGDAAGYPWQTGSEDGAWSEGGTATQASVTFSAPRLPNAGGYYICVRAVDAAGNQSTGQICRPYTIPAPPATPPGPIARLEVSPETVSVTAGGSAQLAVAAFDAAGQPVAHSVSWSSSASAFATVDGSGRVTGVAAGQATITATDTSGISDAAVVTVTDAGGGGGGGGGGSFVFASDWSTATGTSDAALRDTNKNPPWSTWRTAAGLPLLNVVQAGGLGFPSANALRTTLTGTQSSEVRAVDLWPQPAPGQSLYFRLYARFDIPDSYGNLSGASHHPIQPEPGSCPYEWEFQIGSFSDGTLEATFRFETSGAAFVLSRVLRKFQTYRWEWAFHRQQSGSYKADIRIYDMAGNLVADDSDFISRWNPDYSTPMSTKDPNLTFSSQCIRRLMLGYNGAQWPSMSDSYTYYGGMAVRLSNSSSDWIGPY